MSERINEAEVIALSERIAAAHSRIAYAESMLDRCSEFAAKHWEAVIDDAKDELEKLEAPDFRDFSNEHPDPPEPSPERQAQIEYWKQRSLDKP